MKKQEYPYQFLRFETIKTGKMVNVPSFGIGLGFGSKPTSTFKVPETKEVAVVFDRLRGEVKQVEIKQLK